ncbi:MAG: transporter substrate-binding domain-containing protein, partial [Bacteroidota bacterium]
MKSNFLFFVALLLFAACSKKEHKITDLSGLRGGKTFAVPTGTIADQFVKKKFPDARIIYLNNVLDCALAVKGGKAEAAVYDQPVLQNIAAKNEGLLVLPELLVDDQYGFAVQLKDVALKTTMDEVLAELKANGTYEEMMKRWFPQKGSPAPMPEITNKGGNGVLRFGTAAVTEPMSFMDGKRKVVGFDIEFAAYIARKLNKKLDIIDMEFGAMLPALIAGKVDMIGAGLSITEERAKKVLFSKSYYPSGIAALVKVNTESTPKQGQRKKKVKNKWVVNNFA